jgi:hypothetical protein
METGVEIIAKERKRQIEELGYDYTHDHLYANEQLAKAASVYALPEKLRHLSFFSFASIWPWDLRYWKPTPQDRVRELAKAGALIAAQIDYELAKEK